MKTHTRSTLEYKGYIGSVEADVESRVLVGRLLYIKDTIGYSGDTFESIEAAFREAVDDYLDACADAGEQPDVPCKGTFNVRVGSDRHREANLDAHRRGLTLNEWMCRAMDFFLEDRRSVKHHHEHHHTVEVGVNVIERDLVASQELELIDGYIEVFTAPAKRGDAASHH
jgi:predicted HicB family RNase H-like nuclease